MNDQLLAELIYSERSMNRKENQAENKVFNRIIQIHQHQQRYRFKYSNIAFLMLFEV